MSNNFVTPRAVATLSQSRIDYNNSLLALLQNFASSGQPSASSVNLEGVTGLKPGMLWYKLGSNTADGQGRLTIYDGANFVRTGVAVYRMPSGAVANIAIGNNRISSGELIDIGDNRLYMVNSSNTGYVDIGLPPTGYTVDNAQTLDNLDSTQFLRSDVADTIDGPLTSGPMFRITNTVSNSKSVASLWLSGASGALLMDTGGNKRITWNDGTTALAVRAGSYDDGAGLKYTTTGDGISEINFNHEAAHGQIVFRVADIGTAEAPPVWRQTLVLSNTRLILNSNVVWNAGNDGSGSGLDADLLDGVDLLTIQNAYAANDGVTLATARGNDHATLLSARANDLSTYNTLVSEYRANDWNTLSTASANDLATLTSAQANDWNTLATARANDLSTYNTLVSEYRANDWNTLATARANDGVTLSTAIANDGVTILSARANDFSTFTTLSANDGTTLATARGNDHATLLSARANDLSTFTTLTANTFNTFATLSANDGVVRSLAIANDFNGYITFRGEFLGNDHTTLLSARANDFSTFTILNTNVFNTWSGLQSYADLKANINSPAFTNGISVGQTISSNSASGQLVIYGGSGFGGANLELYGPDHPSFSNRIYYDAFMHTFRANTTNAVYMHIDNEGNVGIGTTTASANLHVVGSIRATTRFLSNAGDSPTSPGYTWDQDDNSGFYRRSADVIGVATGGKSAAEFTNTGNFRIFNSTGTFFTEIQSEPTANTALVIPAGGSINLSLGTMATTDTTQNISGAKTFSSDITLNGLNRTVRKNNTEGALILTSGNTSTDGGSIILYGNASAIPNNVVVNADRLLVRPVNTVGVTLAVVGTSNVGVGTPAPSANLHVVGSTRTTTQFLGNSADSNTAPSYSWDTDTNTGIFRSAADTIGLSTGGATRAIIDSSGLTVTGLISGTAVTQTRTDNTAGRLVKVGDVGLLSTVPILSGNASIRSRNLTSGFYGYNTTSGPSGNPDSEFSWAHVLTAVRGSGALTGAAEATLYLSSRLTSTASGMKFWFGVDSTTDINWTEIYTQRSILGTVSQSSGVPTGALIQYGTNANGAFTRWADGTQICYHSLVSSASAETTWTYPAAFSADPVVGSGVANGAGPAPTIFNLAGAPGTTSVLFNNFNTAGVRQVFTSRIFAIGRWF